MISVIIPTLNEEARIGALLKALARETVPNEVILVDNGSEDKTTNGAAAAGAVVLSASGGRGAQVVASVNAARGDIILSLHADSRFPVGGLTRISKSMTKDERLCGGNFRLLFDGDDPFSRWLDGFNVWLRSHGSCYGDSGIFVRRDV